MSARVFSRIPRQFARGVRFQRMAMPQVNPKMWSTNGMNFRFANELNSQYMKSSRTLRQLATRMRVMEMQRLQIGALYMFSYVSKEFLEILKHYEDLLEEIDVDEEEERTTLKGRQ
ncbi:uncharacterized protein [Blastocystis hominis]|uniref:Uncharacterized protein n=1 Tax=Blastocystis hominis TaxID=12968 RepID=D8M8H4_BLAHO|nr:uncharacterized protein [Blastocystis hominis]CBK24363.2 unnamed protein product [Blastocystis hominis]|eukprot:XP_012898411.1 uncharacterized protein [Blastocystis hominis]